MQPYQKARAAHYKAGVLGAAAVLALAGCSSQPSDRTQSTTVASTGVGANPGSANKTRAELTVGFLPVT